MKTRNRPYPEFAFIKFFKTLMSIDQNICGLPDRNVLDKRKYSATGSARGLFDRTFES